MAACGYKRPMPESIEHSSHAERTEASLTPDGHAAGANQKPIAQAVKVADKALGSTHNPWIVFWGLFAAGLVATGAILAAMVALHDEIIEPQTRGFDLGIMTAIHSHASPALMHIMFTFTDIGSAGPVFALLAATLAWLLLAHRRRDAAGLVVTVVAALALNQVLKVVFQRQRPTVPWALAHERNFSFPSGHAMMGIVVFGMFAYLLYRHLRSRVASVFDIVVAAVLVIGIGLSRVYIGVHYPTDILGGWLGGGIWLVSAILAMEALHRLYPAQQRA